ncbi:hypothetical protein [Mesorhizobium sp.]|uniref:hypothetical protein n=1 Tax=Mesorhizobium sp. TaxID=1871066 RepID=UPI002580A19C|nr:hypothetical protein [Mesorhizobium sp.]
MRRFDCDPAGLGQVVPRAADVILDFLVGRHVILPGSLPKSDHSKNEADRPLPAGEVLEAVIQRRAVVHLAGGFSLRRARVMEGERVEVVGCAPAQLGCFKALGCYTEIMAWNRGSRFRGVCNYRRRKG